MKLVGGGGNAVEWGWTLVDEVHQFAPVRLVIDHLPVAGRHHARGHHESRLVYCDVSGKPILVVQPETGCWKFTNYFTTFILLYTLKFKWNPLQTKNISLMSITFLHNKKIHSSKYLLLVKQIAFHTIFLKIIPRLNTPGTYRLTLTPVKESFTWPYPQHLKTIS